MTADASPFHLALELASNSAPLLSSVQPPEWTPDSGQSRVRSLPDVEHSPSVDPLDEIDVTGLDDLEGHVELDGHSDIDASPIASIQLDTPTETVPTDTELSSNIRNDFVPRQSDLLRVPTLSDNLGGELGLRSRMESRMDLEMECTANDAYDLVFQDLSVLRKASTSLLLHVLRICNGRYMFTTGTSELDDQIAASVSFIEDQLRATTNTMSRAYRLEGIKTHRFFPRFAEQSSSNPRLGVVICETPRAFFQSPLIPPIATSVATSSGPGWDTASSVAEDATSDSTSDTAFTHVTSEASSPEEKSLVADEFISNVAEHISWCRVPWSLVLLWLVVVGGVSMLINSRNPHADHPIWEEWRSR